MDELEIEHECKQCSTKLIIKMATEAGSGLGSEQAICPKCGKIVDVFPGHVVAIIEDE